MDQPLSLFFQSKYIKQLILNGSSKDGSSKAYKYRGVSRFIDEISVINKIVILSINSLTRDKFPFFIVRILHLPIKIPSTNFYGSTFSELLRIKRCTLRINDFIPRASHLFSRMIAQGGIKATLTKLKKAFHGYTIVFQKLCKTHEEINTSITKNT